MSLKTVIIVTGPTASGKTALAIDLADRFHSPVISADSRQCFRELNIGVAKPSAEELKKTKHYFVNSHSISDEVNAAIFESLAIEWCDKIFSEKDTVIMCGGTGLYIKAFCDGLDEIPNVHEEVRKKIIQGYQEKGMDWLNESIRESDPEFYATGEIANPQRMMRALEVILSTGKSIIRFRHQKKKQRSFRILEFALRLPRKELYKRINERVDDMMESGLLDEVKLLQPYQHLNALQTVGYSELFDHLNGRSALNDSIALIKQNTRHYAKRQETWLNKNEDIIWLDNEPIKKILEVFETSKI